MVEMSFLGSYIYIFIKAINLIEFDLPRELSSRQLEKGQGVKLRLEVNLQAIHVEVL